MRPAFLIQLRHAASWSTFMRPSLRCQSMNSLCCRRNASLVAPSSERIASMTAAGGM